MAGTFARSSTTRERLRALALRCALPAIVLVVSTPLLADAPGDSCDPRRGDLIHVTLEFRYDLPTEINDATCTPASYRYAWRGCLDPVDETPEGPFPAPRFSGTEPVEVSVTPLRVCRYNDGGEIQSREEYGVGRNGETWADLELFTELEPGRRELLPTLRFTSFSPDPAMVFQRWQDDDYSVVLAGLLFGAEDLGNYPLRPELAFTPEEFRDGFVKTYQILPGPDTEGRASGSLTLAWKQPLDSSVELAACLDLGPGDSASATATGRPGGGTYRFRSNPASRLEVDARGAAATVRGGEPGEGELEVEYHPPSGQPSRASRPATVTRLESMNGGQPLPVIPLWDVDGKAVNRLLSVPVAVVPADGADRLTFAAAHPSVVTAVGLGASVQLQPLAPGKTSLQARTRCGGATGPPLAIEIVNCDRETIATLERMTQAAKENFDDASRKMQKLHSDAGDVQIAKSGTLLILKTGGLIIGTLAGMKGQGTPASVGTYADLYGTGGNVLDYALAVQKGDVGKQAEAILQQYVQEKGGALAQAAAGAYDTLGAAADFGTDLGKLEGISDQLEALEPGMRKAIEWVQELARRRALCRERTKLPPGPEPQPGPQPEPGPEPTPDPDPDPDPTPDPDPSPDPGDEPPPPDPEPTDEPPQEPPPPEEPPTPPPVGLPYEPGCRCETPPETLPAEGALAAMGQGFGLLRDCTEKFSAATLEPAVRTAESLQTELTRLGRAGDAGSEELRRAASASVPRLRGLLAEMVEIGARAEEFESQLEACQPALERAQSALQLPLETEPR